MYTFKEFLIERTNSNKSIYFIDIDETLFHTFAKIKVLDKNNTVIKQLSNNEFNSYTLGDGESYDFGEFRDSTMFDETSIPIEQTLKFVRDRIKDGDEVVFLTARASFDSNKQLKNTFRKNGINMNKRGVYIEMVGNLKRGTTEERKKYVINKFLLTDKYTKVTVMDDYVPNLKIVNELMSVFPKIRFTTIYIKDGKISRVK